MTSNSNSDIQNGNSAPRRSQRLYVQIRVRLEWRLEDKALISEDTQTCVVNAHGALVRLVSTPKIGRKIIMCNISTKETQEAIVVFISKAEAKDGKTNVGIEFTKANASFWQVSFPPEDWSPSHPDAKS